MVDKYDPEIVGKAVQQWHCSDAIKIMLVAAIKLIEETSKFKVSGEQIIGAQGIMRTYFEALLNEVEVARTIIRLPELEKARDKIMELAGRVNCKNIRRQTNVLAKRCRTLLCAQSELRKY